MKRVSQKAKNMAVVLGVVPPIVFAMFGLATCLISVFVESEIPKVVCVAFMVLGISWMAIGLIVHTVLEWWPQDDG